MSKTLKSAKDVKLSPTRFGALAAQSMGDSLPFDYELPMLSKDFHKLSRMSKLNTILDLAEPEEFVRNLPAQEVHHLVHHIGIEDAAVLVPHTTTEQFQVLLDLDLWQGSEFQATRFERWMWALDEYGDSSQLCTRIWEIDAETVITILIQWARIHLVEHEDDPPNFPEDSVVFNSPDLRFEVEVFGPNAEDHFPTVFRLIDALYANEDLDEVHALLDRVASDLPDEVEEDLLKFRNARLEDIGFLPMDEAITMFQFMDPEEVRANLTAGLEALHHRVFSHEGAPLGTSLMALGDTQNFLTQVLASFSDQEEQEQFIVSFSYLCNRAYSVGRVDLSDIETLGEEARTVFGRLNMAVEFLSGGNVKKAAPIVRHMHLVHLHRIGASLCEKLGRQARWILNRLGNKDTRHFFDTPYDEVLMASARQHPEFPEALSDSTSMLIRPFKNLAEVRLVEGRLRQARLVTDFLVDRFGLKARTEHQQSLFDLENEEVVSDTRMSSLWLTLLVHHEAQSDLALGPVKREAAESWARDLLVGKEIEVATEAAFEKSRDLLSELAVSDEALIEALELVLITPATKRLVDGLYGVEERSFDKVVLSDLFLIA